MIKLTGISLNRDYEEEELELSDEQLKRNDEIDNTVFDCIKTLAEKPNMEWDMLIIGDVTDSIKDTLQTYDIKVRHPGITVDDDGTPRIVEFD